MQTKSTKNSLNYKLRYTNYPWYTRALSACFFILFCFIFPLTKNVSQQIRWQKKFVDEQGGLQDLKQLGHALFVSQPEWRSERT